ncbi:MAG TPA: hypothetical protein VMI10_21380 [Terriglobales bacterium]|nr:hypothetical protein [Terriglobales bacterium]
MKRIIVTIAICFLAATFCSAQCPDWSPKFDQITNPEVIAKLHEMNWDQAVAQSGGPEQVIAALKVTRRDAQQRLENADRAAEATKASSGPVQYDATYAQCKSGNVGAHGAAKCEHLNMTEMILSIDGSIDLVRCRQN